MAFLSLQVNLIISCFPKSAHLQQDLAWATTELVERALHMSFMMNEKLRFVLGQLLAKRSRSLLVCLQDSIHFGVVW